MLKFHEKFQYSTTLENQWPQSSMEPMQTVIRFLCRNEIFHTQLTRSAGYIYSTILYSTTSIATEKSRPRWILMETMKQKQKGSQRDDSDEEERFDSQEIGDKEAVEADNEQHNSSSNEEDQNGIFL